MAKQKIYLAGPDVFLPDAMEVGQMRRHGHPEVIVTDRLRSYRAAMKEIWQRGPPSNRPMAQQSSRKLTSTVSTTRASDGQIQEDRVASEVRLHPFFRFTIISIRNVTSAIVKTLS